MKLKTVTSRLLKVVVAIAMVVSVITINNYHASAEAGLNINFSFYNANDESATNVDGTFYVFITGPNNDRITKTIDVQNGVGSAAISQIYDQNGGNIHDLNNGNYSVILATRKNSDITETTRYDQNNVNTINNGDVILGEYKVSSPGSINYNKDGTNILNITAKGMGTTPYSKSSILSSLGRTTDFGAFAKNYKQGADTESTVAAENATINADYGFSNNNFQFVNNTLTVSKTYTKNGQPVANKQVEIKVYRDDINTLVGSKTGTTDGNGYFSLTFDHLTDGSYKVVEVINGQEVSSNKVVKDDDNNDVNVTFSESNPITIHTGYSNINYFTNITNSNILNKCRTPGVIVVGNSQDYNTYKSYSKTGLELIQASDSASDYRQTIDFDSTLDNLADLSKNLASATTSSDVQVYYLSANDIAKKENKFYTNGKSYIVVNVDLTGKDSHNVEGEFCIDDQKISADFGHGDQGRDTKILFNFYTNNNGVKEAYSGTLNQGSMMTGVILAPKATYNGATGNLGGTIIAKTYTHNSGEIHQEKTVSSVSKSIDIGNTITTPTEAEAEISFIKVSKTFNGLSNEEINGLLNDFSITVTNKNNSSQTYTLPLSSASRNGNTFEWRLEGLPSGTYLVKESGANVDGTTHSLKVNGENAVINENGEIEVVVKATEVVMSQQEIVNNCNFTKFAYEDANMIVAKLTQGDGYFVWTKNAASISVREGIIALINSTEGFSPQATLNNTYFFSGLIDNTLIFRGDGISYDGHVLRFTKTKQWSKFFIGYSTVIEGTNADISFVNKYIKPTSIQFNGTKTLTGRDLEAGEFSFELKDSEGNAIETVTNGADGQFQFSEITYNKAGRYSYTISEVQGSLGGVTYDTAVKNITVEVTDNGDGTLTATRKDSTGDITFTNTYRAQGSIQLNGTKTLTGRLLKAGEFSFEVRDSDNNVVSTATNKADGTIEFLPIIYNQAGTYSYTISEVKGSLGGITYDETIKNITVEVTDNGDGTLSAVTTTDSDDIAFANTYEASGKIQFNGTKTLTGRALKADEFSFALKDSDGKVIETVKNNAEGKFQFSEITYNKAGTYSYTISEVRGSLGGITYDEAIKNIKVKVTDNGLGKLVAEIESPSDAISFTNSYHASGKITLRGTKALNGREMDAEEFKFVLKDSAGVPLQYAYNKKDGSIVFNEITYNEAGTYSYTISEVKGTLGGITYDETIKNITVKVSDNGDGTLSAVVDTENSNVVNFTNTYGASGSIQFNGTKTLTGRTLKAGEFSFELKDSEGKVIETVKNKADGTFQFAAINYGLDDIGEHKYTISEVKGENKGITYDETVKEITVKVTDNKQGTLETEVTSGSKTVEFANTYEASGSIQFNGTKTLTGRTLKAGEFKFELKDSEGKVIEEVTNKADGTFQFSAINYGLDDIGEHTYTVSEVQGSLGGVTYDTTVKNITVEVTDNGNGTLKAVTTTGSDDIAFTNTYGASGSIQFNGTKTLTGRDLEAGEFSFELKDSEGNVIETVKNKADGTFQFAAINYGLDDIGEHTYTVSEVKGQAYAVTYDETVKNVTVNVSDNGDGTLEVESNYEDQEMQFRNSYDVVDIAVNKQWLDFEDKYGLRPDSITVQLLADGELTDKEKTIQPDQEGNWTCTFNDLPKYKDGVEIVYTVQEVVPDGYTSKIGEYDPILGGYTIVNSLEVGDVQVTKNLNKYNTTADGATFAFKVVGVYDGKEIYNNVFGLTFKGKDTQSFVVKDLPVGTVVTVTEEYSGSAYKVDGEDTVTVTVVKNSDTQEIVLAEFNNIYDDYRQGHGAINRHKAGQEGYE